jgi:hypothetical protein
MRLTARPMWRIRPAASLTPDPAIKAAQQEYAGGNQSETGDIYITVILGS